jgi:hypothetical protein
MDNFKQNASLWEVTKDSFEVLQSSVFRCFGNTEVREWEFFGNSVFPNFPGTGISGIRYSRSGLPNFQYSRAFRWIKKIWNKIQKTLFFSKNNGDSLAFLGFPCIFRIPVQFQDSRAFSYYGKFPILSATTCLFCNTWFFYWIR